MKYHFSKKSNLPFQESIEKITAALQKEGFGILTTIDVRETFKKKLNVDFRNYKILGACNPDFALKALTIEPHLGVMLPCNIAVQEENNGDVIISAINPMETMATSIQNKGLEKIAEEVGERLSRAVESCLYKQQTNYLTI
jgi:uncharacterized protein (DUF302 family)